MTTAILFHGKNFVAFDIAIDHFRKSALKRRKPLIFQAFHGTITSWKTLRKP
jgi:hypothetical protein